MEKEEDRLLNGHQYENFPDSNNVLLVNNRWKQIDGEMNAEVGVENIAKAKSRQMSSDSVHCLPAGTHNDSDLSHLIGMREEQHDMHQQMEARNRWKELELQTPDHNLSARHHKMDVASKKTQPKVFYDHEGRYQRERAGMYKTSYDPYKLQHLMNHEETAGSTVMDYTDYTKNSLDYQTNLNDDIAETMRFSRTLGGPPGSVPQLNNQPSQHETFGSFDKQKQRQKSSIQPNVQFSDARTQERGVVLTESSQGENYNTHKFLQEHTLHPHSRQEPLGLMSSVNQDLKRVSTIENTRSPNDELLISSQPLDYEKNNSLKTEKSKSVDNPLSHLPVNVKPQQLPASHMSFEDPEAKRSTRKTERGGTMQKSKSSNFLPTNMRHSWSYQTSYQNQHKGDEPIDMSNKFDDRFHWKIASGHPRPQTSLLKIQDSFNKSDVKKKFYARFCDNAPDLRENIVYGKKHGFGGVNAQILRGAPVIEC